MPTVTIDNKEYNLDDLPEGAKNQLLNLQFVQNEIKRLESQISVFKTAANSYTTALKQELPSE